MGVFFLDTSSIYLMPFEQYLGNCIAKQFFVLGKYPFSYLIISIVHKVIAKVSAIHS